MGQGIERDESGQARPRPESRTLSEGLGEEGARTLRCIISIGDGLEWISPFPKAPIPSKVK